jgi:23S rRNA (cytosine1962-C5)-methyltransferase
MSLPVVVLARSGVLRLRDGHPWLFAGQVERQEQGAEAGLVELQGPVGRPRGFAVLNPDSKIRLRVVSRDPVDELAPDFWQARLDAAIDLRTRALAVGEPACRWVHAEADGLPGLVVDRYADIAVLQAGCGWADRIASEVARRLVEHHGVSGVLARHDGAFRRPESLPEGIVELAGKVPHELSWTSGGLRRSLDPWTGQKTGAYLDQRLNHARAAELLPEGRCLDAFCHDGGFALHLARAGRQVLAVDGSDTALAAAHTNAELNGLLDRIEWRQANVFHELRRLTGEGERFDGIVLDPPAMAHGRGGQADALRGYKELNLRALRLLRDGGRLMTCSCSFHVGEELFLDVLRSAAADARRDVRVIARHGAAPCHPQRLAFPESCYLKVVVLEATGAW